MDAALGSDQSLEYTVASSSGHSGEYFAENILIDAPNDSVSVPSITIRMAQDAPGVRAPDGAETSRIPWRSNISC
jgi:hypothetical protein